jgi:translocator protein
MFVRHPFLFSLGVCVLAAAAEGIAAGRRPMRFLATLRQPRFAPSSRAWIIVGVFYYVICLFVLARLFRIDSHEPLRNLAIAFMLALMATNAFYNYLLFRLRNLYAGLFVFVPYGLIAIALMLSLFVLDRIAALIFLPYVAYLVFAGTWAYKLWRLNRLTAKGFAAG